MGRKSFTYEDEYGNEDDITWENYEEEMKPVDELISEDPREVSKYLATQATKTPQGQKSFHMDHQPRCRHDGYDVIYTFKDGKQMSGASGSALDGDLAELVIDLAGLYSSQTPEYEKGFVSNKFTNAQARKQWDGLNKFVNKPPPIVRFHWTDMGIPPVSLKFWEGVIVRMPKSSRTIICCHGGHGRTGTALASMIIADPKWEKSSEKILLGSGHSSKYKVTDVIDYIRDRHCNKAIETTGQEDYLEKLLSQRFSK